jgi:hypothetical protein
MVQHGKNNSFMISTSVICSSLQNIIEPGVYVNSNVKVGPLLLNQKNLSPRACHRNLAADF